MAKIKEFPRNDILDQKYIAQGDRIAFSDS